jgi:hypothetical protein
MSDSSVVTGFLLLSPGRFITKMVYRYQWAAVALVALLFMTSAYGGSITMATQYSLTSTAQDSVLKVTVENRGDVPAHAVQIAVEVEGSSFTGATREKLGVGKSVSTEFPLTGFFQAPGRYPFVIRTYYKDAAGQRYTALIVGLHERQPADKPDITIQGVTTALPTAGKGRLTFLLRNKGSVKRNLDLSLYLPDELSAPREHAVLELAPSETDSIVFELENYSARTGSRYPVTLVGSYEEAGGHYSVAGTAFVRVGSNVSAEVKPSWVWFMLCALLPIVIISLRLYERKKRLVAE